MIVREMLAARDAAHGLGGAPARPGQCPMSSPAQPSASVAQRGCSMLQAVRDCARNRQQERGKPLPLPPPLLLPLPLPMPQFLVFLFTCSNKNQKLRNKTK